MDEHELVDRAKSGDRDAFGELVRLHQARLRAFAACSVPSSADVLDIVQDAFLDAFRHMNRFDSNKEFGPWLRAICRNRIRNFYRARRTSRTSPVGLVDGALEARIAATEDADPADALARIAALRKCVGRLRDSQRQLVTWRYGQNIAVNVIAARLKQTATAISMRLMRIRESLRKCLLQSLQTIET
ncbi:MAG: sigma-70 family RNA polymerase sigma factor [Kiritimatiellae bacterium]|nr:sigma-70 family RNA polymerase sigma factor [Kiritimatiellia bacterium]